MKLRFWGVRGSINSPLSPDNYTSKIKSVLEHAVLDGISEKTDIDLFIRNLPDELKTTYGGNTSCVTISDDRTLLILDAGTGIRNLGSQLLSGKFFDPSIEEYNILFSHLHLDHINGLPFFAPVHVPGKKVRFFSHHEEFEQMLKLQQNSNFFPVSLESRPSSKEFIILREDEDIKIGDFVIMSKKLNHPNGSYAYSIEKKGKKIVYATDAEYTSNSILDSYSDFFRNADVLIFDSQYNFNELAQRYSFGHSTAEIGVDAAVSANVKKLLLFHHNHESSDRKIIDMKESSINYLNEKYFGSDLDIIISNEGTEINF